MGSHGRGKGGKCEKGPTLNVDKKRSLFLISELTVVSDLIKEGRFTEGFQIGWGDLMGAICW